MPETFTASQARAARELLNRLDDMGWLVFGDYVNVRTPLAVQCPAGHDQDIRPVRWRGSCDTCNPCQSRAASGTFKWKGANALRF